MSPWYVFLWTWWRHQMETFSALLAIYAGNSSVSGEFPAQRSLTRSLDVFFDLRLDGRLSKHSRGWWLETPSCPLWRQSNEVTAAVMDKLPRKYGPVTMIVPASGHQVRCIPWVQMGTFNKEIGLFCRLNSLHWIYFVGNTYNRVYIWYCKYGENRYCERCANK